MRDEDREQRGGLLTVALIVVSALVVLFAGLIAATAALSQTTNGGGQDAPGQNKMGVCHATGSATNPYVYLEAPPNSAHFDRTKHPADIYPVSGPEDCPAGGGTTDDGSGTGTGGGTTIVVPGTTSIGEETDVQETMPDTGGTTVVTPETPPGGGTTVVGTTPEPGTTAEATEPDQTVTTPILPALELHYICTSEGFDRFAVKNLSSEAVEVTFKDATGEQTFRVEGQGYYLVDGKVSRGSLPVAKLFYQGILVDEVSVRVKPCEITAPPEEGDGETTGNTTGDRTVPDSGTPAESGDDEGTTGGPEGQPLVNPDAPGASAEAEGYADQYGGAGPVPGPDVVDRVSGLLPDTGGASILLPAAALLVGVGILAASMIRRIGR